MCTTTECSPAPDALVLYSAVPSGPASYFWPLIVIWGLAAWGFFPAQQSQLMQVAGLTTASIALSLNASFMYLGFSLGAMLGSLVLLHASVATLGLVGAVCEIAAVLIVMLTVAKRRETNG